MTHIIEYQNQPASTKERFLKWYLKFIFFITPFLIVVHVFYLIILLLFIYPALTESYVHEGSITIPMSYIFVAGFSALWIYSTHYVSNKLNVTGKKFRPMLTMICFLIPVLNCIYPPIKMLQIWKASDPNSNHKTWKQAKHSKIMIINWFLFAILNIMMIIGLLNEFYLSDIANKIFRLSFFGSLLTIIIFMYKLYYRQHNKAKALGLLETRGTQYPVPSEGNNTSTNPDELNMNQPSDNAEQKRKITDEYGGDGDYHNTY